MPRITKAQVAEAVAALPFSPSHAPDSPDAFANLSEPMQAAIVAAVHEFYYVGGHSAGQTRKQFAGVDPGKAGDKLGLPGPLRRKLFRKHGFPNAIAPSYPVYLDGEPRAGSAHARMHGTEARERQAEAAKLAAKAEVRTAEDATRKQLQASIRANGGDPGRIRSVDKLAALLQATRVALVESQAGPTPADADADAS